MERAKGIETTIAAKIAVRLPAPTPASTEAVKLLTRRHRPFLGIDTAKIIHWHCGFFVSKIMER